ncbi:hypothetical protein AB4Y32_36510 [Paraburkholderia phymatum]|uniref:Uncharacterized protein n=1 Tax=Paraburkholderia phymatum TaxID=148447 RepID=A0ACC6UBU1_9BURK
MLIINGSSRTGYTCVPEKCRRLLEQCAVLVDKDGRLMKRIGGRDGGREHGNLGWIEHWM